MSASPFATRLVAWQHKHGRHDLPWQHTRDPYAVWLSEIMLQQTQVSTVRDYFARFMQRFPSVADLAAASEDEVLALWSGLGYYSRARNLHRAAQQVMTEHGGAFPRSAELLQTLPGIGRSTAAAVASLCFDERVAILDGNVKRVLTRYLGYGEDLAQTRHERALWALAQDLLPESPQMATYTQAVMDLGATVCTPRQPNCAACPVRADCVAVAQRQAERYPVKTRKLKRHSEAWWLLVARNSQDQVWLTQRPAQGVWARLFCVPMFAHRDELLAALPASTQAKLEDGLAFKHVLTHKDLHLHPVFVQLPRARVLGEGDWVDAADWPQRGLPAPIRALLQR
jgi:A/G-specific adenine glycosylase